MSGWWGYPEPIKELEKEFDTKLKNAEKESRMQFPKIDQMAREFAKYASETEEQSPEIQADLESLKYIMDNRQKLAESVKQKLGKTLEECREYMRIIEFLDPEYAKSVSEKFRDWYLNRD